MPDCRFGKGFGLKNYCLLLMGREKASGRVKSRQVAASGKKLERAKRIGKTRVVECTQQLTLPIFTSAPTWHRFWRLSQPFSSISFSHLA